MAAKTIEPQRTASPNNDSCKVGELDEREYSVEDVKNIAGLLTPSRKTILPEGEEAQSIYNSTSQTAKGLNQKELEEILAETTQASHDDIVQVISAYQSGTLTDEQAGLGVRAMSGAADICRRVSKPICSHLIGYWERYLGVGFVSAGFYCIGAGSGLYGFVGGESQLLPSLVAIGCGMVSFPVFAGSWPQIKKDSSGEKLIIAMGFWGCVIIPAVSLTSLPEYKHQQWEQNIKTIETSTAISKSEKETRIRLEISKYLTMITTNEPSAAGQVSDGMDYAIAIQKAGFKPKEAWQILSKINSFFYEGLKTSDLESAATAYVKAMGEYKTPFVIAQSYLDSADLTITNTEPPTANKKKTPQRLIEAAVQIMKYGREITQLGYENLQGVQLYERLMVLTKDKHTPINIVCQGAKQYAITLKAHGIGIDTGIEYLNKSAARLTAPDRTPDKVVQTAVEMLK